MDALSAKPERKGIGKAVDAFLPAPPSASHDQKTASLGGAPTRGELKPGPLFTTGPAGFTRHSRTQWF